MELDANKIMQEVLARFGAKKSTLLDFNPGASRRILEGIVVDGASIFGDTKSSLTLTRLHSISAIPRIDLQ